MSAQFSDTTNLKGLVQLYEKECGFNYGDVSGDATKLKQFTAEANMARDDFDAIALTASGKWNLDDSNHTDYPIIKTNLVAGQRDYPFTTDEQGNLILDIYKVLILPSATATEYEEIFPVDQQTETTGIETEETAQGVPYRYDKTANGIFLDPIPSYSATLGLKLLINREASYFTSTDTTKKPGVPGLFHKYFYLKPAATYARRNGLANLNAIENELIKMEGNPLVGIVGSIAEYFGRRAKDERPRITGRRTNYI